MTFEFGGESCFWSDLSLPQTAENRPSAQPQTGSAGSRWSGPWTSFHFGLPVGRTSVLLDFDAFDQFIALLLHHPEYPGMVQFTGQDTL